MTQTSVYPLSQWERAGVRGCELTVSYPLLTRNAAQSHLSALALHGSIRAMRRRTTMPKPSHAAQMAASRRPASSR